MTDPPAKEKAYLTAHQAELKAVHLSRFLLIKGEAAHGSFETYEQGVVAGTRKFGAGPVSGSFGFSPGGCGSFEYSCLVSGDSFRCRFLIQESGERIGTLPATLPRFRPIWPCGGSGQDCN